MELLVTIPNIEFVKGIPSDLENDPFFDTNKRNFMVIDYQMDDVGGDNFRESSICLPEVPIIATSASFILSFRTHAIKRNSHYLVLFKNPRDKLQILTRLMYPGHTDFFIERYDDTVRRPFEYLLVDLKTTSRDNCRLRTNVLPGEERCDVNVGLPDNISQELLAYLKQHNLATAPVLSAMQKLQGSMDVLLARTDLGE